MRAPFALLLVFILSLAGSSAEAQVRQPPGRPYRGLFGGGRPPDPNRSRQELFATATALGSYGDDLETVAGGPASPLSRQKPFYRGTANAGLRYFRGRDARSMATAGRGYVTAYDTTGKPSIGGDFQLQGDSALGKKNRLSADAHLSYVPFFTIRAFDSLGADLDPEMSPDANPMNGIPGYGSWHSVGSVRLSSQWTRLDNTSINYGHSRTDHLGPTGFDLEQHAFGADYTRSLGRVGLTTSYDRSEQRLPGRGQAHSLIAQDEVELSVSYAKRVSRNRELRFSVGAGASRYQQVNWPGGAQDLNPLGDTQELSPVGGRGPGSWSPSGHAEVGVNIGRSWDVQAHYRRSLSVLSAITADPLVMNTALLQLGGLVWPRLELGLSSGYSTGRDPGGMATSARSGSRNITAQAHLKYAVARSIGAVLSYSYYEHRVGGLQQPGGVPPRFERTALNVGVSLSLPLYGTWDSNQRPAAGRSRR